MLLKGRDGSEFEATIAGYEFPGIEGDQWDSNWLLVAVRVQSSLGSGSCTDPCLTTWEAERLVKWLEAHAEGASAEPDIRFLEPNLGFEILDVRDESLTLRAYFVLERGAYWKPTDGQRYRRSRWKSFVDLAITREDLKGASASLWDDLRRFPLRAWS